MEIISESVLRVVSIQFQHRASDKAYNLERIANFVKAAASQGARLAVFPEMCITGYWHIPKLDRAELDALAEPVDGPSVQAVREMAARFDMAIGIGLLEVAQDRQLFNTYVICMPNGELHSHRKLHAFEHELVSSGDRYTVFDTQWGIKIGILICWDNNLIENVRATALLGATILIAPHQTGGTHSRSPHAMKPIPLSKWHDRHHNPEALVAEFQGPNGREWLMRWLPARAHDSGIFVIFSNGVGQDEDEVRTGNAMILDPYGRIIAETTAYEDAMVVADLDLQLVEMSTGQRWLRGRRPELYSCLTEVRGDELPPREARFSTAPTKTK
ncbi:MULTISPECIES: nitrilase family protein [Burkholderia]|uniref:nitrilase family protein n=1 Tax=Burkholderia TaxID=32008 RepID=UPI001589BD4A|nr:nitrilase family protein [Burkholderia seminalis]